MPAKKQYRRIFIITPSYNQAAYIKQNIESVLSQRYLAVSHIVQDGGSTDDTVKVLKSYGKAIRWVSQKDQGQTDAINRGLAQLPKNLGSDDIVAYLNSDDYYLPRTLLRVSQAFDSHPDAAWVVGDAKIVDEKGNEIQSFVRQYKQFLRRFFSLSLLAVVNPFPQPSVFVRGSVITSIGSFDASLRYTMDYDYWWRVWKTYGRPLMLDVPLSAFRIHRASKGSKQFVAQFQEQALVARRYCHNPFLLLLGSIHNAIICGMYALMK